MPSRLRMAFCEIGRPVVVGSAVKKLLQARFPECPLSPFRPKRIMAWWKAQKAQAKYREASLGFWRERRGARGPKHIYFQWFGQRRNSSRPRYGGVTPAFVRDRTATVGAIDDSPALVRANERVLNARREYQQAVWERDLSPRGSENLQAWTVRAQAQHEILQEVLAARELVLAADRAGEPPVSRIVPGGDSNGAFMPRASTASYAGGSGATWTTTVAPITPPRAGASAWDALGELANYAPLFGMRYPSAPVPEPTLQDPTGVQQSPDRIRALLQQESAAMQYYSDTVALNRITPPREEE